MDKLEKALAKARSEREQSLGRDVGVSPSPVRPAEPVSPPPDAQRQSRYVSISQDTLERHRVVAALAQDANSDAFRMLRTKILRLAERESLRAIAITSPNYGDGKSTIAINLAISMVLDIKTSVCLVDLDFRKPSLASMLEVQPTVGLDDYLMRDVEVSDCLIRPGVERLVVFPIRDPMESSSELLTTPKMLSLAAELKSRYPDRFVIYDLPPILAQDDVIAFLPSVDGVVIVVREGVTPAQDVRRCLLELTHSTVIGTILNASTEQNYNRRAG